MIKTRNNATHQSQETGQVLRYKNKNVNIGMHDTNSDELLLDTRLYMIVD